MAVFKILQAATLLLIFSSKGQEILQNENTCQMKSLSLCAREKINSLQRELAQKEEMISSLENKISDLQSTSTETGCNCTYKTQTDCLDIYNQNIRTNGIYRISPDDQTYFDVYCDMDGGGWTLIQRRVNAYVNFSRGWNEYVNGFGDLSENFWLGLEKIRLLTHPAVEIMFEGYTIDTNEKGTMRYNNFYIDPLSNNYTMHVNVTGVYNNVARKNNYDHPAFNGFGYNNGDQFSTYDRPDPQKCVQTFGDNGGWWYRQCAIVFTTGNYDNMYFLYGSEKVKRVTIKIRRNLSY